MAHDQALAIVNMMHEQLADLARAIVTALNDGTVAPWEGMQLGMQGMTLASSVMALVQGLDTATRDDVLYVLEHSERVLPPGTE